MNLQSLKAMFDQRDQRNLQYILLLQQLQFLHQIFLLFELLLLVLEHLIYKFHIQYFRLFYKQKQALFLSQGG